MKTVSLCMIVRDEEQVLERCLKPLRPYVEEIVIADTGSADGSWKIAEKYADKLTRFSWCDDFAKARNFTFEQAEMDYCMWLDADDVMEIEALEKLAALKENLSSETDIVMMPYYTGKDENGRFALSYYRERLLKNDGTHLWKGRVHEAVVLKGRILYSDIPVLHCKEKKEDTGRNLRIYEDMEKKQEMKEPRDFFYYGRELQSHGKVKKAAQILRKFQDMENGWIENKIESCLQLSACMESLGREEEALKELMKSLLWGKPRAEICCGIGRLFMKKRDWETASFWYEAALHCKKNLKSGGFAREECYGFLPAIQLCVCCDRMGKKEEAFRYHLLSRQYCPESPFVLQNERYFSDTK